MVAGWQVFGLVPSKEERSGHSDTVRPTPIPTPVATFSRAAQVAPAAEAATGQRRIDVASAQAAVAANDTGSAANTTRETKIYATTSGGGQVAPLNPSTSRTRGIGNRFRSVGAGRISRKSEKTK